MVAIARYNHTHTHTRMNKNTRTTTQTRTVNYAAHGLHDTTALLRTPPPYAMRCDAMRAGDKRDDGATQANHTSTGDTVGFVCY